MRDRTVADLWGFCRTATMPTNVAPDAPGPIRLFGKAGNNPLATTARSRCRPRLRERLVQIEPAPGAPFATGVVEIVVGRPAMSELNPVVLQPSRPRRGADLSVLRGAAPWRTTASALRAACVRGAIFTAGATLAGMAACTSTSNNAADASAGARAATRTGAAATDGGSAGSGGGPEAGPAPGWGGRWSPRTARSRSTAGLPAQLGKS